MTDIAKTAATQTARSAVENIFTDLRDRRFLKWLFDERGEECLIDTFRDGEDLRGLDLFVQGEIKDAWAAIIQKHLVAMLAMERERCARVAENITNAECKEIVREERWVDMTDDYGEPLGQMAESALHRIDYRKGIAAAIRRGEE